MSTVVWFSPWRDSTSHMSVHLMTSHYFVHSSDIRDGLCAKWPTDVYLCVYLHLVELIQSSSDGFPLCPSLNSLRQWGWGMSGDKQRYGGADCGKNVGWKELVFKKNSCDKRRELMWELTVLTSSVTRVCVCVCETPFICPALLVKRIQSSGEFSTFKHTWKKK